MNWLWDSIVGIASFAMAMVLSVGQIFSPAPPLAPVNNVSAVVEYITPAPPITVPPIKSLSLSDSPPIITSTSPKVVTSSPRVDSYVTTASLPAILDTRTAGILAHVNWLFNQNKSSPATSTSITTDLFYKQVGRMYDQTSKSISSLSDSILEEGTLTDSILINPTFSGLIGSNISLGTNWLSGDGDNEGVYIDSNGNVGIGTSTPGSLLAVAGTANIAGTLTVTGTTTLATTTATTLTLTAPLAAGSGGTGLNALGSGVATFLGTPSSANLFSTLTTKTGNTSNVVFSDSPTFSGTATFAGVSSTNATTTNLTVTSLNNLNGAVYTDLTGKLLTTATGGVGTLCLTSTNGGTPVFGTCAGSASTAWASLSSPSADLELSMSARLTTFTWDDTSTSSLFTLQDTAGNTGTGALLNLTTTNASRIPFSVVANNTDAFLVSATGNVGIGTTTPAQMFTVGATTGSQFLVTSAGVVTGILTNATGLPISTGLTGAGTGVLTALGVNVGTAGAFVVNGGALGTPSSGTLTSATGLPISTGVSGLGSGVATFLATSSSSNLLAALTDETGTGSSVFSISPTFTGTAIFAGASSTNATTSQLTVTSLTANRIPYVTTGGRLVDNSNLTFDGTTLTAAAGSTITINSTSLTIADTDITLSGATTNLAANGDFSINTSNLFITKSSGNIGIGSTTPSSLLTVAGTANITGVTTLGTTTANNLTLTQALTITSGGTGATTAALARTNLGATTIGANIFTLTNPSALTLLRINADNTVTAVATSTLGIILSDTTGTLTVARGGTGAITLTGLLQGNGTGAVTAVTGTAGQIPYFDGNNTLLATSTIFIASNGKVGIGTTTPSHKLSILNTVADAQVSIAYDSLRYTTLQTDASGNFILSSSNGNITASNDNLKVCQGGSCPTSTATSTAGNLFVENAFTIGSGFSMREISATELGLYNASGTIMIIFDGGI